MRVAVNLAMRNLLDLSFPGDVEKLLEKWKVEPNRLELEITESTIMGDPFRARQVLARLHEMGVRLSIDDFGTGYSSLGYLRNLPVDVIKLDRCFTSQLEHDRHTHEIVRTITTLAHTLGMTVVAEGVESDAQLAALHGLSCDHAQGFLLARPAPSDEVGPVLITQAGLDGGGSAGHPAAASR